VTLRNRGAEAYRPDQYGKSITIIRTIARSGSSGYKVKSDTGTLVLGRSRYALTCVHCALINSPTGKTIATTRREVLMVMEQFNIQIENPCVILMQDTSRAFLNASKPSEKYKFFLSATQLEQISIDYRTVDVKVRFTDPWAGVVWCGLLMANGVYLLGACPFQLNGMKQTLENKKDVLPDLKKRVQELEHLYREAEKLRDLESQVIHHRCSLDGVGYTR
jgi:chromosome segregation ATPase